MTIIYISTLIVDEKHRNRGIDKKLIQDVLILLNLKDVRRLNWIQGFIEKIRTNFMGKLIPRKEHFFFLRI